MTVPAFVAGGSGGCRTSRTSTSTRRRRSPCFYNPAPLLAEATALPRCCAWNRPAHPLTVAALHPAPAPPPNPEPSPSHLRQQQQQQQVPRRGTPPSALSRQATPHATEAVAPAAELDNLVLQLHAAVHAEDFARAAALRDAIDAASLHAIAARAKPRFAPGLVVWCCTGDDDNGCDDTHGTLLLSGYRAVVLSAAAEFPRGRHPDERAVAGETASMGPAPEPVVWYRAAVDVRDRKRLGLRGGNVRLVREDELTPVRAPPDAKLCDASDTANGIIHAVVSDSGGDNLPIANADRGVHHPVIGTMFGADLLVSEDGFHYYQPRV